MRALTKMTTVMASVVLMMCVANAEASNPCNPCSMKKKPNPCNPCSSAAKHIRKDRITDYKKLVAMGKSLWSDKKLGNSDMACLTCHSDYENLNLDKHNGVWPHDVPGMTDDIVTLTQMVNVCMLKPMEANPIDPHSIKMTAMVAYYYDYIMPGIKGGHMKMKGSNPCNPCSMKKKPNPCNPCSMKKRLNPCNPCAK